MIKKITDLAVNAQQQFSTLAIDLVAFNIKAKKKLAIMLKERDELITMFSLFGKTIRKTKNIRLHKLERPYPQ